MRMRTFGAAVLALLLVAAGLAWADGGRGRGRGSDDAEEHGAVKAVPAVAQETADPQPKAKALFESKCSACHPVSRPLGKNKDETGWTATVKRMQQVNGCPITDEEAREIIAYLTRIRGPK